MNAPRREPIRTIHMQSRVLFDLFVAWVSPPLGIGGRLGITRGATLSSSATFTSESASGWQQVLFATPVPVTAGTTYVASYHAPAGGYSVDEDYFASAAVTRGPLTALRSGERYVHPTLGARLAQAATQGPQDPLTERERDITRLLALGHTNQDIAEQLFLSVRTVERHLSNAYLKLGISGRTARTAAVASLLRQHPS